MLTKTLYRAFILLILLFFAVKPFFLGFYHDDWSTLVGTVSQNAPFSSGLLTSSVHVLLSRPISGFTLFLFGSLAGSSPFLWQVITSCLVFIGIFVLAKFLSLLAKSLNLSTSWEEPTIFAAFFFALPWMVGATFFVIAAMCALPAAIFFFTAGICVLTYLQSHTKLWLMGAGIFYLLSILTYEAFYLQFVFLALLGLCARKQKLRTVVLIFLTLLIVQGLGVVWNRFTFSLAPASKSINADFLPLFLYTLKVLPERFFVNFQELSTFALVSLAGYFFYTAVLVKTTWKKHPELIVTLCVALLGVVTSVLLYAVAGYGVDAHGLTSRTTIVISFYIVLLTFVIQLVAKIVKSDVSWFQHVAFFCLMLVTFSGLIWRFRDWKVSWQEQRAVISAFPASSFKDAPKDTIVIYKGPFEYNSVTIFQSSWDLTSAINYSYPNLHLTILPNPDVWEVAWDGTTLTQIAKGNNSTLWSSKTKHVWIWDYPTKNLVKLK